VITNLENIYIVNLYSDQELCLTAHTYCTERHEHFRQIQWQLSIKQHSGTEATLLCLALICSFVIFYEVLFRWSYCQSPAFHRNIHYRCLWINGDFFIYNV